MTSPKTLMLNSAILGVLISLGTYIKQGSTEADLLNERSFAATQAIIGLGLHHLSVSWLVWLFALLVTLSVIGLALRHVVLSPLESRRWSGPSVDTFAFSDTRDMDTMRALLQGVFGRVDERNEMLIVRQGYWFEGLCVLSVSVVCLIVGLFLGTTGGMEARMGVAGTGAAQTDNEALTLAVQVLEEGTWIERQLPFSASCAPTALVDPRRGWRCSLTRTLSEGPGAAPKVDTAELALGPSWPDDAFGMTFHVAKEHPLPTLGERIQLVDLASDTERLLFSGPSGRTAKLSDGQSLTAFKGPDGPMVVVTPPEGRPLLLVPAQDKSQAPYLAGEAKIAAVTPWWLTLRASKRPGQPLLWTGLALFLLGVFVLVVPAHRVVLVRTQQGETLVSAWSFNRVNGVSELRQRLSPGDHQGGA